MLRSRQAQLLLAYLAVRGAPVTLDELAAVFSKPAAQPLNQADLHRRLARLQRLLPEATLLDVTGTAAALDSSRVWLDQREFERHVERMGRIPWETPDNVPLPAGVYAELKAAAALWRGPWFMQGTSLAGVPGLQQWAAAAERLNAAVLTRLAEHAAVSGRSAEALDYADRALAYNELDEGLNIRLLLSLLALGRRTEAAAHYASLEWTFQHELGITLGPTFATIYPLLHPAGPLPAYVQPPVPWRLRRDVDTPLIGRQEPLAQLLEFVQSGQSVFITGESGMGKTRLLLELYQRSEQVQRRILPLTCGPTRQALQFHPVVEMLRNYIRPGEWLDLPAEAAAQLVILLPELARAVPGLPPSPADLAAEADSAQKRQELLEAVRQVLVMAARAQPLLVCIDDLQWADAATLETLAYVLARPPFGNRASLAATIRSDEKSLLEAWLSALEPAASPQTIALAPFSWLEISQLIAHQSGYPPAASLAEQLAAETGGNPLYVLEILHYLSELDPAPNLKYPIPIPLPASLHQLLRMRLDRSSPEALRLLEAAAVLGSRFESGLAVQVSGSSPQAAAMLVKELEQRLLISPLPETAAGQQYLFTHAKIREVLLNDLPPERARLLHGRAARVLASRAPAEDIEKAAILAEHFEAAGEIESAVRYWLLAGWQAARLLSQAQAAQAFEHAAALVSEAPHLNNQLVYELYTAWGQVAYWSNDAGTLYRVNNQLRELGRQRRNALLSAAALNGLSDACMVESRFAAGLDYTLQAGRLLENSTSLPRIHEHARALNRQGSFHYLLGDLDESIAAFQDSLAISADLDDVSPMSPRANALSHLVTIYTFAGLPAVALQHGERAMQLYQDANSIFGQAATYAAMGLARVYLGDFQQARRDCLTAHELSRRSHFQRVEGNANAYRAMVELAVGDLDAALQYADAAIEYGERSGHGEISGYGYRIYGDIYLLVNAPQQAVGYYQRALETGGDVFIANDFRYHAGLALIQGGKIAKGQALMAAAIQRADEKGFKLLYIYGRLTQLTVEIRLTPQKDSQEEVVSLQADARQRGLALASALAGQLLGDLAFQRQDLEAGVAHYQACLQQITSLPYPTLELHAQVSLLQALRAAGQASRPEVQLGRARSQALAAGLQAHATRPEIRSQVNDYCAWVLEAVS